MKKSELKQGMVIQTASDRYGFIELDKNRIDICYDPRTYSDKDKVLEKVSLDDIFEFGDGQLGIGKIVTEEDKATHPTVFEYFEVGEVCIWYEINAVYNLDKIYDRWGLSD